MSESIIIKGRLTSPTQIELERPVSDVATEVGVVLHRVRSESAMGQPFEDFLNELEPGQLSREEMDAQLNKELDAWEPSS